jgi:hypothetical protein
VENAPPAGRVNAKPVMAVAAIGLTPISPVIEVAPVVEIPAFDRITKLPADPRLTASGPAANVIMGPDKTNTGQIISVIDKNLLRFFIFYFLIRINNVFYVVNLFLLDNLVDLILINY